MIEPCDTRTYLEDQIEELLEGSKELSAFILELADRVGRGKKVTYEDTHNLTRLTYAADHSLRTLLQHVSPARPQETTQTPYKSGFQEVADKLIEEWKNEGKAPVEVFESKDMHTATYKFWEDRTEYYRAFYSVDVPEHLWEEGDFAEELDERMSEVWMDGKFSIDLDCFDGDTHDSGCEREP